MWKHVTLLVATILAFCVSIYFMQQLIGFTSPWMALLLMLCFLGLARVADPLFILKVPRGLQPVRAWELRSDLSRRLGIAQFGDLLRNTPLRFFNTSVYLTRDRPDSLQVRRQLESAEGSHFWAALLLVPYLVFCAWSGWWAVLGGFLFLQVIGHLYPILHLRRARGRLERAEGRRTARGRPVLTSDG